MNTKELFAALEMLEKEKGIPMDYMIENIEKGIEVACKNYYGGVERVGSKCEQQSGTTACAVK